MYKFKHTKTKLSKSFWKINIRQTLYVLNIIHLQN